eukprot:ctg_1620.g302
MAAACAVITAARVQPTGRATAVVVLRRWKAVRKELWREPRTGPRSHLHLMFVPNVSCLMQRRERRLGGRPAPARLAMCAGQPRPADAAPTADLSAAARAASTDASAAASPTASPYPIAKEGARLLAWARQQGAETAALAIVRFPPSQLRGVVALEALPAATAPARCRRVSVRRHSGRRARGRAEAQVLGSAHPAAATAYMGARPAHRRIATITGGCADACHLVPCPARRFRRHPAALERRRTRRAAVRVFGAGGGGTAETVGRAVSALPGEHVRQQQQQRSWSLVRRGGLARLHRPHHPR